MNKNLLFALTFISGLIFSDLAFSQTKHWVMFKNKTGTPYSISTPTAFLSAKSIGRRVTFNIPIDATDLPVTPSYVSQVDAVSGVTVLYRSKWLNGIVISVTNTTALTAINSFTFVQTTNKVNRYKLSFPVINAENVNDNSGTQKNSNTTTFNYGTGLNQAQMIGADCMHNQGFRGQGITIAVLDAGFTDVNIDNVFDSLFMQGRVMGTYDFVSGNTQVYNDHTHGAMVLSTMAACKPGTMIGTAPKANYWLLRTEDGASESISEEYNWIRGAEFADSVGADICTTSLGYNTFDGGLNDHTYATLNGKTAPMSIAATMATRKGMVVLNAAGNEGAGSWYYITVPADADSIITVGAVDPSNVKASFSGHGPTADGRIKPDLVAQGAACVVCLNGSGCFPGNGTSFATPVLAGAVACLLQARPFSHPMTLLTALKASADSTANPNNRIGWGAPNMCTAKSSTILAVNEQKEESEIKIYPNPFNNELVIMLNRVTANNATITITDILGREVHKQIVNDPNATAIYLNDLKDQKAGLYFVNISSPEIHFTQKIVKQ